MLCDLPTSDPLPKSWPRRVRSAVAHAISLAETSLTFTRNWAANSYNARILKAENDRLRQEIGLHREEIRIKEARMERIPAQRRPHQLWIEGEEKPRLPILLARIHRDFSRASPEKSQAPRDRDDGVRAPFFLSARTKSPADDRPAGSLEVAAVTSPADNSSSTPSSLKSWVPVRTTPTRSTACVPWWWLKALTDSRSDRGEN